MGQAQVGEGVSLELYDRLRELPTPLSRIWSLDPLPQGQWDAEPRMCPWKGSGVGRKVWGTPFAAKDPEAYGKWGLGLKWNFSNGHLRFSPPPTAPLRQQLFGLQKCCISALSCAPQGCRGQRQELKK